MLTSFAILNTTKYKVGNNIIPGGNANFPNYTNNEFYTKLKPAKIGYSYTTRWVL